MKLNPFFIENVELALDSIKSVKQNLNYLYIDVSNYELSSNILLNLEQILSHKLEYLLLKLRFSEFNISD